MFQIQIQIQNLPHCGALLIQHAFATISPYEGEPGGQYLNEYWVDLLDFLGECCGECGENSGE